MTVIKKKTGCFCSNCDNREAEYVISNNGTFKLFWANGEMDCEIAFCEECARELNRQLTDSLSPEIST